MAKKTAKSKKATSKKVIKSKKKTAKKVVKRKKEVQKKKAEEKVVKAKKTAKERREDSQAKVIPALRQISSALTEVKGAISGQPWYKNRAWVTIASVIVAISAVWIARAQHHKSLRDELHQYCVKMKELRAAKPEIEADITSKMSVHLYGAIRIVNQLSDGVTPSEYVIIANELVNNGDYALAQKLFEKAVESSLEGTYEQMESHRNLGKFHYNRANEGRKVDESLQLARESYRGALAVSQGASEDGPYREYFTTGSTYMEQGYYELSCAGNVEKASKCYLDGMKSLDKYTYGEYAHNAKCKAIKKAREYLSSDKAKNRGIKTTPCELFGKEEVNKCMAPRRN